MFSVTVRDHFMIAHSFRGQAFGPAQALHGATYVVDLELRGAALDADGVVVDIGRAAEWLGHSLAELNYRNLDDAPEFAGRNTTTESLAKYLFDQAVGAIHRGALGEAAGQIEAIKVTLRESHVAWAAYEGPVPSKPA